MMTVLLTNTQMSLCYQDNINDQDLNYKEEIINSFVDWCDMNHLVLNIRKLKK